MYRFDTDSFFEQIIAGEYWCGHGFGHRPHKQAFPFYPKPPQETSQLIDGKFMGLSNGI